MKENCFMGKTGKMIRCETISNAFQQDLSKFYRFHEVLEQLFPNIHRVCENTNLTEAFFLSGREKDRESPFSL